MYQHIVDSELIGVIRGLAGQIVEARTSNLEEESGGTLDVNVFIKIVCNSMKG